MKTLIKIVMLCCIIGCSASSLAPGTSCSNNGVSGVAGSNGQCYTCTGSNYAYYGYLTGFCGSPNGAGVSCCNSYYIGYSSVVCSKSGYPYLCSNGECYSSPQSGLYCVYDP